MFKKAHLIAAISLFFLCSQTALAVFSDVASNHPHYEAITYLQDNGIIEGYADNTFRPDQLVNRAEAIKIILLGSKYSAPEIEAQDIFPDVIFGTWYAKYVYKAKTLGIVSGDSNTGMFRPGDTVNLAEALKILLRTKQAETFGPTSNPYPDVPADAWFAPYFSYAKNMGLLDQSSSENVYPATPINRGMLAELMYRISVRPAGYQEGKASYYGSEFHGETTASGEVFDASAMTAAHRTLPFNSWVRVTSKESGDSVEVRINDRGPYSGDRLIDLSKGAFESIAPLSRGVINVSIVPISGPSATENGTGETITNTTVTSACPETANLQYFPKTSFDNIALNSEIPSHILEGEVLTLSGTTSNNATTVSAFIVDSDEDQISFYTSVTNKTFKFNVFFPETGTFKLGLIPSLSGSSVVKEITVLPKTCLAESSDTALISPSGISFSLISGETVIKWDKKNFNLIKITFAQGDDSKSYILYGLSEFTPYYPDFEGFTEGSVAVSVQGANLTTKSILEQSDIDWSPAAMAIMNAVKHYEYNIDSENIQLVSSPKSVSANTAFNIEIKSGTTVMADASIITPEGDVEDVKLINTSRLPITNSNGISVYPPSDTEKLVLTYTPKTSGIYFVEINNADSLAVLNIPLYQANQYPLLPNPVELYMENPTVMSGTTSTIKTSMLTLVNADRAANGKTALKSDTSLASLAQYRADDMAKNNYFSHWDSEGRSANDLRKNYAINQVIAENIAKDLTADLAEYGLMRSAIHRANILSDEWTRAGFGLSKLSDGSYIFVQIFSADPIDLTNTDSLRTMIGSAINENRGTALVLNTTLNTLAQNWSNKMVTDNFFDFTATDGSSLVNSVRDANINSALGTYIVGNTSLQSAIDQITANSQLLESNWKKIGIGIKQDSLGIIKITLIYTE